MNSKDFKELKEKVDQHLKDGILVITKIVALETNVEWIKRGIIACFVASLSTAGMLATALVVYLLNKK